MQLALYLFTIKFSTESEWVAFEGLLASMSPPLRLSVGMAVVNTLVFRSDDSKATEMIRAFLGHFFANCNISIFSFNSVHILFEFVFQKFLDQANTEEGMEWLELLQDILTVDGLHKKGPVVEGVRDMIHFLTELKRDELEPGVLEKLDDILLIF